MESVDWNGGDHTISSKMEKMKALTDMLLKYHFAEPKWMVLRRLLIACIAAGRSNPICLERSWLLRLCGSIKFQSYLKMLSERCDRKFCNGLQACVVLRILRSPS